MKRVGGLLIPIVPNLCSTSLVSNFYTVKPALPVLKALVKYPDDEVKTDALWAMSYISDGDNSRIQGIVELGQDLLEDLVGFLSAESRTLVVPALRTLGNLVTGDDLQTQATLNAGLLKALAPLLQSPANGVRGPLLLRQFTIQHFWHHRSERRPAGPPAM